MLRLCGLATRGVVLLGVVLLAACGEAYPGSAAAVDGRTISVSEVDDVATALCTANAQGQSGQSLPSRGARQSALSVLLRSNISLAFGAQQGVTADPRDVAAAISQNQATIDALPADQREVFSETVKNYAEGQLVVIAVGKKLLEEQGGQQANQNAALAAGEKARVKFADGLDVDVDPRFGTFKAGELAPAGGSLSVPVSSRAKAGEAGTPDPSWVSGLPAAQTCG